MQLWRRVRRHGDVVVAVALAVGYAVELLGHPGADLRVALPLGVAACLTMAFRRRSPLAVFVIVTVLNVAADHFAPGFLDESVCGVTLFMFNLYSLGANAVGVEAWLGVVGVAASVVGIASTEDGLTPGSVVFYVLFCGLPWGAGLAVRLRAERIRELSRRNAELADLARQAVVDERARIARELHDVVSHAIAVTVLQARGAAKLVGDDDARVLASLRDIEQANTAALTDMRRLLALLRETDGDERSYEPQPSLDRLSELLDSVRGSGLPVTLTTEGDPVPVPPGIDLSAFRIVQEALTNVLKHAGPHARATVHLTYLPDALTVEVANTASTASAAAGPTGSGGGHGLVGVRERVSVAGGTVTAAPTEQGYVVQAHLPYAVG